MMIRTILAILATALIAGCRANKKEQSMDEEIETTGIEDLKITVVYDNRVYEEGLEPAWGFSCLVEGSDKTLLFDTGGDGRILTSNMSKLEVNPEKVDVVVLSHRHGDHVGGLDEFLDLNPDVSVYMLASFPAQIKKTATDAGANLVEVSGPQEICTGIYSTGSMGTMIAEQSLVIATDKGTIVITGCAHPGIVEIVKKAKELTNQEILFVMGGFHLMGHSEEQVKNIISEFRELGVSYAGACHCTGDRAIELFAQEYGDRFVEIGVGRIITSRDLIGSH